MAAEPNIGGALCESSVIPFLIGLPIHKFWLTALLECRAVIPLGVQQPPKVYRPIYCTRPGDVETPCKVLLASVQRLRCSDEARTRNRLKFAGVSKTRQLETVSIAEPLQNRQHAQNP